MGVFGVLGVFVLGVEIEVNVGDWFYLLLKWLGERIIFIEVVEIVLVNDLNLKL